MSEKQQYLSPSNHLCWSLHEKLVTETSPTVSVTSSNKLTYEQMRVRGHRAAIHSPQEIANEFRYENGKLYYKQIRPGRSIYKPAGHTRPDLYIAVSLKGQIYLAHRVVWCLHYGYWPTELIDHINGIRHDNRIENLREVTVAENRLNVRQARNDSGVVGVTWAKKERNWRASININGKGVNLGHFSNLNDAIAARKAAELEHNYR